MQLNVTTVLLMGILGLVTWKLLSGNNPLIGTGATSPSSNPLSSTPPAGQPQPDVFTSLLGVFKSGMEMVTTIAQTSPKTA